MVEIKGKIPVRVGRGNAKFVEQICQIEGIPLPDSFQFASKTGAFSGKRRHTLTLNYADNTRRYGIKFGRKPKFWPETGE